MPYAQVRGVNLYYEDRGQGQPLLLIPGALGTGLTDFSPQLEQLPQQGIRVIVPDARGYGKSRPPVRQFPLDFYEQDAQDCGTDGRYRLPILCCRWLERWSDHCNACDVAAAPASEQACDLGWERVPGFRRH